MKFELNLTEKLDFANTDLTAPEIVIREVLSELPGETRGFISGQLELYNGPVYSFTKKEGTFALSVFGNTERKVDIQDSLGKIGEEMNKFECYLFTPNYDRYKYRMFFMEHGISNYPASVILDESIAHSIARQNTGYIYTCSTRPQLEELLEQILTSKRTVEIMQELIRISQSKSEQPVTDEYSDINHE